MNNDDKSEDARPEDEMIMSDLEERMKFLQDDGVDEGAAK